MHVDVDYESPDYPLRPMIEGGVTTLLENTLVIIMGIIEVRKNQD